MRSHPLLTVAVTACTAFLATSASASTVGLWLFDDLVDQTPPTGTPPVDPPGGETLYDSSPNHLHFVSAQDFGSINLTTDRPSIMPPGSFALDSNGSGARLLSTPSSSLLHVGKTGQMTVEFWLKSVSATSFPYVLSFNGGNGGGNPGDWGVYINGGGNTLNYFAYPNSGFPERSYGTAAMDGNWHHIAATVAANDSMKIYLDGTLVGATAVGAFPAAAADILKFGRDNLDGQTNAHFLIDELRISDVALLPGNGDGNGVLAWNASLATVPEPSSIAAIVVTSLGVRARRRR